MRILRPSSVLLSPTCLRTDLVLVIENGRFEWIDAASAPTSVKVECFDDQLWTAPPIMFHAHLESWDAPAELWRRSSFSEWVADLLQWRSQAQRQSATQSFEASWSELAQNGCGAVFASASDLEGKANLSDELNGRCEVATELFAPDAESAAVVWGQKSADAKTIALHSPFGCSEQLAKLAFQWLHNQKTALLSLHLGEHEEEREYLATGKGKLAELLHARGRDTKAEVWASPVDWLEHVAPGKIAGTLAVHCGDLSINELKQLQEKQVQVVWCPGTHQYFDRKVPKFWQAKMPAPLLGCDSKASNLELSPLREVRIARQTLPEYGPTQWWAAITERSAGYWHQFLPNDFPQRPFLRLKDPKLSSATEVCDYLTAEHNLKPLQKPGLPKTTA
ncbi:MAG: amidohydrolase family protein [Planctomycetes bacterium]|nr:amidohydrolase family protein [Planctomycetota bacterium]